MQSVNLITDARYSDDKPNVLHAVKTDQLLVDGVYLKPGQKTGWHKHPDADRAYLCVQGSGELVLETVSAGNELRIPLGLGAVALAPRGVFYDLIAGPGGMVCSALSRFPVRVVEKG
jgi:oxalate decarboxylase/phosphoglucose isomerase-like protein (cupin superfamily)